MKTLCLKTFAHAFARVSRVLVFGFALSCLAMTGLRAQMPDVFNVEDYFPLDPGNTWTYEGFNADTGGPGSQEDNFRWDVLADTIDTNGVPSRQVATTVFDVGDSRMDDIDFWYLDGNGDLFFTGFHNGVADGDGMFPAQTIILTDSLFVGGRGMQVGAPPMIDISGQAEGVRVDPDGSGPLPETTISTVNVTSQVDYVEFRDVMETPLGNFKNVLHTVITITIEVPGLIPQAPPLFTVTLRESHVYFAKKIGMIRQDQGPDRNDAEHQAISEGAVQGRAVEDDLPCADFSASNQIGGIGPDVPGDLSGMVASRMNSGVLWLVFDDGAGNSQPANIYAINTQGQHIGTYTLDGADNINWEEIAIGGGPMAGRDYLYIGDIGDDTETRANVSVYRVLEPTISSGQSPALTETLTGVEEFQLQYPGGPEDALAMIVDPVNDDIFTFENKSGGKTRFYRKPGPHTNGSMTTLEHDDGDWIIYVNERAAGGDVSPTGDRMAIRTKVETFIWTIPDGWTILNVLLSKIACPCAASVMDVSDQGESITFDPLSDGFFTSSDRDGMTALLSFYPSVQDGGNFIEDIWEFYQ